MIYFLCACVCVCVQVGIVNVALCAPSVEGSYTSHWRLAHAGEQFGPRVWCSIVVDPLAPAPMLADGILVSPCVTPQVGATEGRHRSADRWTCWCSDHTVWSAGEEPSGQGWESVRGGGWGSSWRPTAALCWPGGVLHPVCGPAHCSGSRLILRHWSTPERISPVWTFTVILDYCLLLVIITVWNFWLWLLIITK